MSSLPSESSELSAWLRTLAPDALANYPNFVRSSRKKAVSTIDWDAYASADEQGQERMHLILVHYGILVPERRGNFDIVDLNKGLDDQKFEWNPSIGDITCHFKGEHYEHASAYIDCLPKIYGAYADPKKVELAMVRRDH